MESILLLCNVVLTLVLVYMAVRDDRRTEQQPRSFFKTKADALEAPVISTKQIRRDRSREI